MAGWTKMPLGMQLGLCPGDFVLDGEPASPQKKRQQPHPIFGPCLLWPKGSMDDDATWYGSRPQPRPHCVRRGPSFPRERGTAASSPPPSFRPMSIVTTVAHLSYCWAVVTYTDHFSGPSRAIGPVCVCLYVRAITLELNDLWSRYSAGWFSLTVSTESSMTKIIDQSSMSQEENNCGDGKADRDWKADLNWKL